MKMCSFGFCLRYDFWVWYWDSRGVNVEDVEFVMMR